MIRKFVVSFMVLVALVSVVYSVPSSMQCKFETGSCSAGWVPVFYGNKNFFQPGFADRVLSSNVALTSDSEYSRPLCCYSPYGAITVRNVDKGDTCLEGEVDFMYYTDDYNARVGIKENDTGGNPYFNMSHYTKKTCIKLPVEYGSVKLIITNRDYSPLGYSCLFKTSWLMNGVVSSCDSTFNGADQYQYSVWGQMFENLNTLNCNSDCISVTTQRISADCAQKIDECNDPNIGYCNGALPGTWVHFNSTHEIKCERPWDEFRTKMFTDELLNVTSVTGHCNNIVSKKHSVLVGSELVNLRVFVCEE